MVEDLASISNPSWTVVDEIPLQIEVGRVCFRIRIWRQETAKSYTQRSLAVFLPFVGRSQSFRSQILQHRRISEFDPRYWVTHRLS